MTRISSTTRSRIASLLVLPVVCLLAMVSSTSAALAAAASPVVTGPVTGGNGAPVVSTTRFDLAQVGYTQSEFFLSGTATAYAPTTPLTSDGKWTVGSSTQASYTTRAVVYRPSDARRFNGAVIVEWLNVSAGLDAGPDWVSTHNELVRDGFVWVGVSAQAVGVNATKASDPVRYASLSHPGDSFSYDIFSQAGQAVRDNSATVLGGLTPGTVLAAGESQSAGRLVTYIDAVHPLVDEYDGFLVHSRGASGAPLSQIPQPPVVVPSPTPIRDDLSVPVLVFQTETDVFNSNLGARQPDTDKYRLWEVAGTAQFDTYGLSIGPVDIGDGQGAVQALASIQNPTNKPLPGLIECDLAINTGPMHWVLDAAVYWLNRWVAQGTPPPSAPRLQTIGVWPVVFALDANGNVLGGIRTPQVDAPIATLGGVGNTGAPPLGGFCRLFGTTVPFTATQLAALYKNHRQFVSQWGHAVQDAAKAGFLLQPDAQELKNAAAQSQIGR